MDAVMYGESQPFFIEGPRGMGKTFLYYTLVAKLQDLGNVFLSTTSSGIAASNIPTGRTYHSRFKIPIDSCTEKTCSISKQSLLVLLITQATLIIWDEVSMAKREDIESVDALLCDLCGNDHLFGGKVVVLGGDFRQILHVLTNRSMDDVVCTSLVSFKIWHKLVKIRFSENMRSKTGPEVANFLQQLGNGCLQHESYSIIHLPNDNFTCEVLPIGNNSHMIASVYPTIRLLQCDSCYFSERDILCPTKKGMESINNEIIDKFPRSSVVYIAYDTLLDENSNVCAPEFLNSLTPPELSPFKLLVKENCPVIIFRNLDPAHGLCNGTRLICTSFSNSIITYKFATGQYSGETVVLPRISLRPTSSARCPFEFQRKKFPIKLCFTMTITSHKGRHCIG